MSRTDSRRTPGYAAKDRAFRWPQQRRRKVPARGAGRIAGPPLPRNSVLPRRDRNNVRRSTRHRPPIAARIHHRADQQPPLLLPTRLVRCALARRRARWRWRTRGAGRGGPRFVDFRRGGLDDRGRCRAGCWSACPSSALSGWARQLVRRVLVPARAGASSISTSVDGWRLGRTTELSRPAGGSPFPQPFAGRRPGHRPEYLLVGLV